MAGEFKSRGPLDASQTDRRAGIIQYHNMPITSWKNKLLLCSAPAVGIKANISILYRVVYAVAAGMTSNPARLNSLSALGMCQA